MAFQKVGYADGAVELTALSRSLSTPRGAVAIYPTFMNTTPGSRPRHRRVMRAMRF